MAGETKFSSENNRSRQIREERFQVKSEMSMPRPQKKTGKFFSPDTQ